MKAKDVKEREKVKKIETDFNLKILVPGDAGNFEFKWTYCIDTANYSHLAYSTVNYPKYGDSVSV